MKLYEYMDINRIEFSVTNACTGRCRHCSVGDVLNSSKTCIDKDAAVSVVNELSKLFNIESVMTFGGEPLLFADTTCAIHKAAMENGIPKMQLITNGYFTRDDDKIAAVAKALGESGVNSLLLSVDAFHQEHIPLKRVHRFAKALLDEAVSGVRLQPAWVVNRGHDNSYNKETERCLGLFTDLGIPVSSGNDIFLSGNAAVHLSGFYERKPLDLEVKCGEAPYTSKLDNVEAIAINPNGDVIVCCFVIGNIYRDSITEIVRRYNPYGNPMMSALMDGGVCALIQLAEENGVMTDTSQFYSVCGVCRNIVQRLTQKSSLSGVD